MREWEDPSRSCISQVCCCWHGLLAQKSLTASFLAISVSFFHPLRLQAVHVLLELNQIAHPHSGEMLADMLVSALDRLGIEKRRILMVVTDNGANMIKGVCMAGLMCDEAEELDASGDNDEAEDEEDGDDSETDVDESFDEALQLKRFPCIADTLQLVVKVVTKSQSYNNLTAKVKGVVKAVRMSSVGQEQLLQLAGKVLVKDCTTWWNETLLMINRLLDVRSELEVVLNSLKRDSLTNTEWARLADIQQLLGPFRDQTNTLQTDTM